MDKPNFVISAVSGCMGKFAPALAAESRNAPGASDIGRLRSIEEALKMCDENTNLYCADPRVTWTSLNDDVEAFWIRHSVFPNAKTGYDVNSWMHQLRLGFIPPIPETGTSGTSV